MPLRHFVNLINKLNGLKAEEYEDAPQDNDFRQHMHPAGSPVSTNQLVRQHSLGQATLAGSALRERCAVAGYSMCTPVCASAGTNSERSSDSANRCLTKAGCRQSQHFLCPCAANCHTGAAVRSVQRFWACSGPQLVQVR